VKVQILFITFISLFTLGIYPGVSQTNDQLVRLTGSAFVENRSYELLRELCDIPGGRLAGTAGNRIAAKIIQQGLQELGYATVKDSFSMPGWERGPDEVWIISPFKKQLEAAALGYVQAEDPIEGPLEFFEYGYMEDYPDVLTKNTIAMIHAGRTSGKPLLLQQEALQIAASRGAKALLYIHDEPGNLVRARTGDFQGNQTPIPALSISYEQGMWLRGLMEKGEKIRLRIIIRSRCTETTVENIIARLPGNKKEKVVVGAHFDSWDLGQGAIDNGLGTAILFDVARLLKKVSPKNHYSIEFVWFNGEELGLFGSKKYLENGNQENIVAMINLDMTGSPTGFNAMGFDEFVPLLEDLNERLKGMNLTKGVISRPWTNSDHMPFMLAGIPVLSLQATLDPEMLSSYHNAADTFDKVNIKYLSEASAVVSSLVFSVANSSDFEFQHKTAEETAKMLKKFGLDQKLKKQKEWPFSSN
jgi:hypothetical protein